MNSTEPTGHLTLVEIENIRTSLLNQKGTILNKNHGFLEETLSATHLADEAEAAAVGVSTSISIHLHERDRHSLMMIDRALSKIHDGTYGLCESCKEGISARRLFARPFTTLCLECMEDQEFSRPTIQ